MDSSSFDGLSVLLPVCAQQPQSLPMLKSDFRGRMSRVAHEDLLTLSRQRVTARREAVEDSALAEQRLLIVGGIHRD